MFNKVVHGKLVNGLISTTAGVDTTFIVKKVGSGMNNVNSVWLPYSTWANNCKFVRDGALTVTGNGLARSYGTMFGIAGPTYDADDTEYDNPMYTVTVNSTGRQYLIQAFDGVIHAVNGDGTRYRIDLNSNVVYKLVLPELYVNAFDFTTIYNVDALKNNLLVNLKQTMMNRIVQSILDHSSATVGNQIEISPSNTIEGRELGLYLDMFNDLQSRDNYTKAQNVVETSDVCLKFSEVFKNNLNDIDDSRIFGGTLYAKLTELMDGVFGQDQTILMVDEPSFVVTRADQNQPDQFTCTAYFDLDLRLDSGKHEAAISNADANKLKWVIGHAIIKNVKCQIVFTPIFNKTTDMTYTATYTIVDG